MALQSLEAETWGERLTRARRRSGMSLKEAAHVVSQFWPVSHTSLMRLESLETEPADGKRRMLATLTVVAYGFEPSDFGLTVDELPPGIDRAALSDLLIRQKGCSALSAA